MSMEPVMEGGRQSWGDVSNERNLELSVEGFVRDVKGSIANGSIRLWIGKFGYV